MRKFILNNFNKFFSIAFNLPDNSSIIILNGGIGNQLFQYLLGEELRNIYKKNVLFYDIRKSYRNNHNSYIENLFNIKLNKFGQTKRNNLFSFIFLSAPFLKFNKFFLNVFNFKLISNFYFDQNINLKISKDRKFFEVYFGTWHSLINKYKFLEKRKSINFNRNFRLSNKFKFKEEFIALHVRRGDYISSKKTSRYHGNLKKSYFIKSVNYIRNKYGNIPVVLFSDDYKWLNINLKEFIPNSIVFSSDSISAEEDLFYMTKARFFILSNSTFSWWAAFLSTKKNKFIIVPKYWFNKVKTSQKYIYKNWDYKII